MYSKLTRQTTFYACGRLAMLASHGTPPCTHQTAPLHCPHAYVPNSSRRVCTGLACNGLAYSGLPCIKLTTQQACQHPSAQWAHTRTRNSTLQTSWVHAKRCPCGKFQSGCSSNSMQPCLQFVLTVRLPTWPIHAFYPLHGDTVPSLSDTGVLQMVTKWLVVSSNWQRCGAPCRQPLRIAKQ